MMIDLYTIDISDPTNLIEIDQNTFWGMKITNLNLNSNYVFVSYYRCWSYL